MTRKLATAWNASTPLTSGANTKKPLDFNVLQLKHTIWNTYHNQMWESGHRKWGTVILGANKGIVLQNI
jgi:hypothetical protein